MIDTYVAIDLETTGTNPAEDRIIEVGAAKVECGRVVSTFSTFVNPQISISPRITSLTGITDEDVAGAPVIADIIADMIAYTKDVPILGHNVIFDYSFIKKAAANSKLEYAKEGIDTLKIARRILPDVPHKNLPALCEHFKIDPGKSHRALDDAISASKLYYALYAVNPEDEMFNKTMVLNYSVKKDSPITPAQKKYLTALAQYHNVTVTVPIDSMTKSQASRMIDGIIGQYGRIPVY
mgnify:FL=1|jgi:DNA polymerase-3 subunit epsilon